MGISFFNAMPISLREYKRRQKEQKKSQRQRKTEVEKLPKSKPNRYYIYALVSRSSGEPKYVGATSNPRMRRKDHRATNSTSNDDLKTWLWKANLHPRKVKMVILQEVQGDELKDVTGYESRWIRRLQKRGYSLFNVMQTDPSSGYTKHQCPVCNATFNCDSADHQTYCSFTCARKSQHDPDKFKRVLDLRENGLTYKEIAKQMECPVGTVKSRMYRARKYGLTSSSQ